MYIVTSLSACTVQFLLTHVILVLINKNNVSGRVSKLMKLQLLLWDSWSHMSQELAPK